MHSKALPTSHPAFLLFPHGFSFRYLDLDLKIVEQCQYFQGIYSSFNASWSSIWCFLMTFKTFWLSMPCGNPAWSPKKKKTSTHLSHVATAERGKGRVHLTDSVVHESVLLSVGPSLTLQCTVVFSPRQDWRCCEMGLWDEEINSVHSAGRKPLKLTPSQTLLLLAMPPLRR